MIIYFSGTGNSESVARGLLKEGERIADWTEEISVAADERVGFVFPVYCGDVPKGLIEKIRAVRIDAEYVFAVATAGGNAGHSLNSISYLMKEKGIDLDYGTCLKMPDSCILFPTSAAETSRLLDTESARVNEVAAELDLKKIVRFAPKKPFPFQTKAMWFFFRKVVGRISEKSVDEKCMMCLKCVECCPVNNIEVRDGKIVFKGKCEDCYRCIQSCPERAIRFGSLTVTDKTHYIHP